MYNPQHNHSLGKMRVVTTCPKCILTKAAPELLAACEEQHKAIDKLFAMLIISDKSMAFMPSKSGQPWRACLQGNAAIQKAKPKGDGND